MNPSLIHDFVQLIASRTGIQVQDKDRTELVKKINLRITAQKLTTPEAYYQLLATPSDEQEWQALVLLLTTGETYFFRDRGQINLIQQTILPEIIARKQLAIATKPTLRIWSAGCSTGEEPYSIATIVKELIPNYATWNLLILGTDINTESIAKAKTASFSEWSFRMVNPDLKRKYFRKQDKSWQLNEEVRKMVTLQMGNLLTDDYPSLNSNIYNMDMIICRNVFIYFNSDNVETILGKLYQTLSPGGYLIVGHTELHDLNLRGFVPQVYDESVVYQRSEDVQQAPSRFIKSQQTIAPKSQPISIHQPKLPVKIKQSSIGIKSEAKPIVKLDNTLEKLGIKSSDRQIPSSDLDANLQKAQSLFAQGEYTRTLQKATQLLQHHPDNFAITYLIAQTHANLGKYQEAISYCQQAIALDSMSIDIYYLLSHIAEAQNNLSQAKEYLKRIMYIDETAIAAYLDLGNIYKIEGDDRRAKKMFNHATKLLQELTTDTIQYRGEVAVSELLEQVNQNL
ncbi:methylase of chemotaxis methyl-accepting protein [Synechococcus sp. PCC 7502]|uniref:CheR family methyltransferase n=1 Tax=Synechococcus sp. PCC 7502 TaxID=1173263 RepID=UPI00029FB92E|nr:protein-glutamate O-methyltransferase CheR [Synechococcus sp. PCC 7502]AFY74179.1 methylase of chemotaxis methyl-accepting protein [Synechococcus sp. PCC 7502]